MTETNIRLYSTTVHVDSSSSRARESGRAGHVVSLAEGEVVGVENTGASVCHGHGRVYQYFDFATTAILDVSPAPRRAGSLHDGSGSRKGFGLFTFTMAFRHSKKLFLPHSEQYWLQHHISTFYSFPLVFMSIIPHHCIRMVYLCCIFGFQGLYLVCTPTSRR